VEGLADKPSQDLATVTVSHPGFCTDLINNFAIYFEGLERSLIKMIIEEAFYLTKYRILAYNNYLI
jgi:hypothetical protein